MSALTGLALPLVGMFFLGLAFWGAGQWLRRRGHGEALDRIDARLSRSKAMATKVLGPLGGVLLGLGSAMSRTPLLGSKRQRAMWDDLNHRNRKPPHDN